MAAVQLESAMTAFGGIFPADAPVPTLPVLTDAWQKRIGGACRDDSLGMAEAMCGRGRGRAGGSTAVLLASEDGTTVGTAMGQPDPAESTRGHLRALYVLPERWRRGIGRALHDAVLDHLSTSGFELASLWVLQRNESARARYEHWGWQLSPDRQEIYPGVHEVRYLRQLSRQ